MRLGLLLLISWFIVSLLIDLNQYFLPDALGFFPKLWLIIQDGTLFAHLFITFWRVLAGVLIAVLFGIPLGLLMGRSKLLKKELGPIIEFIRGIPTSMLFPLFIVLFGLGEVSKVLIAVYLAAPIVIVSAMIGASPRQEHQGRDDYIQVHSSRISWTQKVYAIVWQSLPNIVAGLKVAISLGLVVIIVTEMFFVASSGIGWAAFRAYEAFNIDLMYIYIISSGILAITLNLLMDRLILRFSSNTTK